MFNQNKSSVWMACIAVIAIIVFSGCSRDKAPADQSAGLGNTLPAKALVDSSGAEPESPTVTDCGADQSQCHEVLDCSDDSKLCFQRKITFDIEQCAAKDDRAKCENFHDRLTDVSLISDSNNFISSPFSEQSLSVEVITDSLLRPWDLEFLPDGSILITEQKGRVVHITTDGELGEALQLEVLFMGESGLMGMAIDPDFVQNKFVYLVYSYKLDDSDPAFLNPKDASGQRIINRISRFTFNDGVLKDELVILDNLPGSVLHTGSRLEFGPDGKLYASTGDAHRAFLSQDPSFLGGKILRMNKDGSIPEDNPTLGSYVYSRGHRNPQGMAWHPETGDLYTSEHGPVRFDEINRIVPGRNHGWGSYKCDEKMSEEHRGEEIALPLVCFKHWNISPSGMEFVSDPDSPWYGSLFVAALRGKHLHRYVFEGDDVLIDEIFFVNNLDKSDSGDDTSRRVRDVEYWNGALYIIGDFRSSLLKITPALH